jgi:hypothetical protein
MNKNEKHSPTYTLPLALISKQKETFKDIFKKENTK